MSGVAIPKLIISNEPITCQRCQRQSYYCAVVTLRRQTRKRVLCSKCRVSLMNEWRPVDPVEILPESRGPCVPGIRRIVLGKIRVKQGRERG